MRRLLLGEFRCTSRAAHPCDHQTAEILHELCKNLLQIAPILQQFAELFDQCRRRALCNLQRHLFNPCAPNQPQGLLYALRRECSLGKSHALIEDRERVTHAAVRLYGNDAERFRIRCDPRFPTDIDEAIANLRHRNAVEVVALTARLDRRRHLVRLRRCEDEKDLRRRLLQCLEECVERFRRQHVYLVDDVDFIISRRRCELHRLAQVANLINAAIGCRVDLEHVHRRSVTDAAAGGTHTARRERRPFGAVERTRENFRRARLARSARSCKQVGMARLPRHHRTGKRAADVLLPHEIGKALRPPAAIECDVGHNDTSQQQKTAPQGCNEFTRFLPRQATVSRRPHGT